MKKLVIQYLSREEIKLGLDRLLCFYLIKLWKEHEQVPREVVEKYLNDLVNISIGKNSNRSITGTLVDMIDQVKYGREEYRSVEEVSFSLARTPIVKTSSFPCDDMKAMLLNLYGSTGEFPYRKIKTETYKE